MKTTRETIKVKVQNVTYTVRPTIWGNWYGYTGGKLTEYFFGSYEEQRDDAAEWLVSKILAQQTVTQKSTFVDRVNPSKFNFSPMLTAVVGAIIGHDYGVRDRKGGQLLSISITSDGYVIAQSTASSGGGAFIGSANDLSRNLAVWLTELSKEDAAEFNRLWDVNVKDWRK